MSTQITPRKSLNKAYLKIKPVRLEIDIFKKFLMNLLDSINHSESEEFNKNVVADFLKNSFYSPNYFINTKGRNDLVIHNNKSATDSVGVIIEVKRSTNAAEMIKNSNLNCKAMQELVLYYLRERITLKNLEIKNLIVTNVNEWFIFDSNVFEKYFAQNKKLVQQFIDFESGVLSGVTTDFFYKEVASVFIDNVKEHISYTYFDIAEIEVALRNSDKGDDTKLIPFFKLLSPQHLLKIPFANDSNSLNKTFYSELLHIIGLEEVKDAGKKIIRRKELKERHNGSLIENAIIHIESLDKLSRLPNKTQYGSNKDEQLFNTAIELSITWVNRILFLKLLEAQLISYHKNDKSYAFLNSDTIKDFDELNTLFFQVLAVKSSDRNSYVKNKFAKVPYLNSSLFEPAEIEHNLLVISNLSDDMKLPIISSSVLKDVQGKRITGELNAIEYLFNFLNSYDFASDGNGVIQEDSKTLINASVLGLIFEKINGYKDGSFFTPGFVTMFMSREALRKTVVDKVNKNKGLQCTNLRDIYNSNIDATELNQIINSIKLCDPAVGSGHFLVSALNEFIAIKAELEILQDKDGKRLKNYSIDIENDELIIADEDGELFEYIPTNISSQRVQETLFNEKRLIIENSLFGVDINPNSVKICRLRLWIELLKNAYYNADGELETLPNIDINIKCGNSLISRFDLRVDLKDAIKKSNLKISEYKSVVQGYKNSKTKDEKREMDTLIHEIKSNLKTEILYYDPKSRNLENLRAEVKMLELPQTVFEETIKERKEREDKRKKAQLKLTKLEDEVEEIKGNKLYENAFEWRFEFPEVLDDNGVFEGFDIVIGNPPYFKESANKSNFNGIPYYQGKMDIWYSFACRAIDFLKPNGRVAFIATNNWTTSSGASTLRNKIVSDVQIESLIDFASYMIFDTASIQTMIMQFRKDTLNSDYTFDLRKLIDKNVVLNDALNLINNVHSAKSEIIEATIKRQNYIDKFLVFGESDTSDLLDKIASKTNFVIDAKNEIAQGIVPNPDVVSAQALKKYTKSEIEELAIKKGAPVFLIPKDFFTQLTVDEKNYVKDCYEPIDVAKYAIIKKPRIELIYSTNKNKTNLSERIINHLLPYKRIMDERRETKDNRLSWYCLHWAREQTFFEDKERILAVRKCSEPTFTYVDMPAYVMMSFNVIKSDRINMKYLTGLLNSSLIKYWLKNKGKMQGSMYQVDKEPLLDLPIYQHNNVTALADLVEKIILNKKQGLLTNDLEEKIDVLVSRYYDLDYNEFKVVIPNSLIAKDDYDNYALN